jgi:gamma-glutamyltranspeptidase/glutathione hydrolase
VTALSACDPQKPAQGVTGYVAGFAGFVSAEEPRAVLVGEDTLSAGGTAADAAVAMAATLTVTLPSRAGWMGGGVCLSRLPRDKSVQAFAFLPAPLPGGGFAPGMPRGLYALHATSGVLRWEQILAPAEQLARFGVPVSRALAKDMATLGSPTALDADIRGAYVRADGSLLREGDSLVQLRTAAALTSLRMKGVGEAYSGQMGYLIAAAMPEQEEKRRAALRAYRVQRADPVTVDAGNETAYFRPRRSPARWRRRPGPPPPKASRRSAWAWPNRRCRPMARPASSSSIAAAWRSVARCRWGRCSAAAAARGRWGCSPIPRATAIWMPTRCCR